jgi:hypothetical protein
MVELDVSLAGSDECRVALVDFLRLGLAVHLAVRETFLLLPGSEGEHSQSLDPGGCSRRTEACRLYYCHHQADSDSGVPKVASQKAGGGIPVVGTSYSVAEH